MTADQLCQKILAENGAVTLFLLGDHLNPAALETVSAAFQRADGRPDPARMFLQDVARAPEQPFANAFVQPLMDPPTRVMGPENLQCAGVD